MSRAEYWNDPQAPAANSLVPACGVLAVDERGRLLLQRRRDTGQWALPMGKMEIGETPRLRRGFMQAGGTVSALRGRTVSTRRVARLRDQLCRRWAAITRIRSGPRLQSPVSFTSSGRPAPAE